ncbi:hypothetical protein VNO77_04726 [Canavalia gladiata]|uniref:Uncharacterized protein n=1 Tax=Canavalia gladiata TaxID=3824 RepID=A0AAN9N243_CANGL
MLVSLKSFLINTNAVPFMTLLYIYIYQQTKTCSCRWKGQASYDISVGIFSHNLSATLLLSPPSSIAISEC